MRAIAKALLMSACVLALAACGDDKDDGGNAGTGTGGGGAGGTSGAGEGGTSGASGGTSGTSGAGGTGGGGSGGTGGTMAAPVVCGGTTCPTPSNSFLRACCVVATETCGEKPQAFGSCAEPVEPHPDCENGMLRSFVVPSCCTAEGRCGIAAPSFGIDCLSNDELLEMAQDAGAGDGGAEDGGMNSLIENVPMPGPCTPQ